MKLKYYLYIRQDVTTRWNSTFLMFERFLALKPALLEMQAQENYRSHHSAFQDQGVGLGLD